MEFKSAQDQFMENYKLFGSDPRSQTEKYNLYNGLANLAKGLQYMKSDIEQINQRIQLLEQKIR